MRPLVLPVCLAWLALLQGSQAAHGQSPRPLFNGKDLTGWSIFIPHDDGADPQSDPKAVFTVRDGVLHVSGEQFGYLVTNDEFENYRLIVEFKWGEKRYPPRATAKRDSGILMHVVGPDKIWPKSIECQIQEGDCGDFWMVGGTALTVRGEKVQGGRAIKTSDAEKPHGEWNTIEVVCEGDRIVNLVNGQVVNEGTGASLTRGKILLQSEGAEIDFRRVELIPLTSPGPR